MANIEHENLQRLVDGELSVDQIREMMISAESNPSQWREIACALVEDQVFERQFMTESATFADAARESVELEKETQVVSHSKLSNLPARPTKTTRLSRVPHGLVLAAGFLIALLTGYLAGKSRVPSIDQAPIAQTPDRQSNDFDLATNPTQPSDVTSAKPDLNRISPASYVEFETPNGEAPQGKIPLYRAEDFKLLTGQGKERAFGLKELSQLLPESTISEDFRKELNQSGYQMNVEVRYVSGNLGDGRKFVVPMRTIRWSPGN